MALRACALFSPRLAPVLARGTRDQDAVVSPQGPTRRAIRQAVLDHEPSRQGHHTGGGLTAGGRQSGAVRVNVRAALRPGVLRLRDHEIPRTPHVEMPQVVSRPLRRLVPSGRVTTTRTGLSLLMAPVGDDLWRRQGCSRGHPCGGIGALGTRTHQGCVLRARMLGLHLYDKGPSGARPKPGKDAIVSYFTRFFRLPNEHWVGSGRVTLRHVSPMPGSQAGLLPPSPLRTARESFPSSSSSLANAPCGTRWCHV